MLNISKLFTLLNQHVYWPNKDNHGIVLFKQTNTTSMFQSYVSHVSFIYHMIMNARWFGKAIYNYPNRIIFLLCGGKTGDEIHTYITSFLIWYWQRLQQTRRSHVKRFHSTTCVTTSNIHCNLLLHLCPSITRSQFLIQFATSRIDRQLRKMSFIH
jgi:hypothetical protein